MAKYTLIAVKKLLTQLERCNMIIILLGQSLVEGTWLFGFIKEAFCRKRVNILAKVYQMYQETVLNRVMSPLNNTLFHVLSNLVIRNEPGLAKPKPRSKPTLRTSQEL